MEEYYFPPWVERELLLYGELRPPMRGREVRKVQEWLCLHGFACAVDGIYGPATAHMVGLFQKTYGLPVTGAVEMRTFERLIRPMKNALMTTKLLPPFNFRSLLVHYAHQHLAEHPREVGGRNRGPWVRLYMRGNDGPEWLWCAGTVSFIVHQAAHTARYPEAMPYFYSVDRMVQWARANRRFIPESKAPGKIKGGDIFVSRSARNPNDWVHTGIVLSVHENSFETAEGNTNDTGSREGYEMIMRARGYAGKDFINMDF